VRRGSGQCERVNLPGDAAEEGAALEGARGGGVEGGLFGDEGLALGAGARGVLAHGALAGRGQEREAMVRGGRGRGHCRNGGPYTTRRNTGLEQRRRR
jgi:hypothetical protein